MDTTSQSTTKVKTNNPKIPSYSTLLMVIIGIGALVVGFIIGYVMHGNIVSKTTDNINASSLQVSPTSQPTDATHNILVGEYSNAQTVIMKQTSINMDGTILFTNINNVVYFSMILPNKGYCIDSLQCNYGGSNYIEIDISKFADVTNESLPNIAKSLLPTYRTKAISFSNYNGIEILDEGIGQAQSGRNVWFIAKDFRRINVVYMISLLGWNKEISDQELMNILNNTKISYQ